MNLHNILLLTLPGEGFEVLHQDQSPQEILQISKPIILWMENHNVSGVSFTRDLVRQIEANRVTHLSQLAWRSFVRYPAQISLLEVLTHDLPEFILVNDNEQGISKALPHASVTKQILYQYQLIDAYYKTILDTVEEAVSVLDDSMRVISWNDSIEKLYGLGKEEVYQRPLSDFLKIEDQYVFRAILKDESVHQVYHQPRPDTHVIINAKPVKLGNRIIGAISAESNVTNIVRLNEELTSASSQIQILKHEVAKLQLNKSEAFEPLLGRSEAMKQAIDMAKKVADTEATVLVRGESGVGKELFANGIHKSSQRNEQPFIALNCGAIPQALFESELFGYVGGSFTGADRKGKKGKLEMADGGTLFLDEVGDLPLDMQVKLLRVLQDQEYYRIGGSHSIKTNVRIIAATNRDLEKMITENEFREDFYYRLNVLSIEIPALRQRKEDIPELVHQFVHEFSVRYNRPLKDIAPEVMATLIQYDWPGNVRELRNVLERLVVLADKGVIQIKHIPDIMKQTPTGINHFQTVEQVQLSPEKNENKLPTVKEDLEKKLIIDTLHQERGNRTAAAKRLGISRSALYYKLRKYEIEE